MTTKAIALVTGANKGIGKEIARGLAANGLTVLVGARDEALGTDAATELAAEGRDVRYVHVDVTDEATLSVAAKQIEAEFGKLDVLINNAGISGGTAGVPSRTDLASMRKVFDTNVFGVVATTNAMLPLLRKASAGRIVNVSSGLGSLSAHSTKDTQLPILLSYNTSKTALNAITVQYARELKDTSITVNACCPGYCATDLNGHSGPRTPAQGAQIAIALATAQDGPTGGYFDDDGEVAW
jgi:NAD(P)-dependent dehydrogenase (short-subunit alcohol dehydrogenase family)